MRELSSISKSPADYRDFKPKILGFLDVGILTKSNPCAVDIRVEFMHFYLPFPPFCISCNCCHASHNVFTFQPFRKVGYSYGPWAPTPSWLFTLNPFAEERRDS